VYSKIENFIRTKYEAKRWVMDGGMPDPSTLDDGDDDVVSDEIKDHTIRIATADRLASCCGTGEG
jgi:stromal membrane-associated protein